jgi:hypothetical protein
MVVVAFVAFVALPCAYAIFPELTISALVPSIETVSTKIAIFIYFILNITS